MIFNIIVRLIVLYYSYRKTIDFLNIKDLRAKGNEMAHFEKMTFLEMTNLDNRIDKVAINSVEDFVDATGQGQIADDEGVLVIYFTVTNVMDIENTDDLLDAVVVVDIEQFN